MGINGLNQYLRKNCSDAITKKNIHELLGQRIVVDASIYLYRFKSQDNLIPGLFEMLSIFQGVDLYFVFDGKPPDEKRDIQEHRRKNREDARLEIEKLKYQMSHTSMQSKEYGILHSRIQKCKRSCVKIREQDIRDAQELLDAAGVRYVIADGEADNLCAELVSINKADACLSDDTDLFPLGCKKVYRYLSVLHETVVEYDYTKILDILQLSHEEFRMICIMAGCDYNTTHIKGFTNAFYYLKKNALLCEDLKIIIEKAIHMFINTPNIPSKVWCNITGIDGTLERDEEKLHDILSYYNFIFTNNY
tara:strand:- start:518 stop:1435 length:918 start_codon:yes stop_codon:yes gene_type:complete